MKRVAIALALLLVCGAAQLPIELRVAAAQREAGLKSPPLDLSLRENLGQMGFIAALGGFRSFIAALLWIEGHTAWENLEWGRMVGLFKTVTTLQPNFDLYWDQSAWHMAWNASRHALDDTSQPSEALRQRASRQYIELGRQFLEDGLKNNPADSDLWARYGDLLREKIEDHCTAAEAYEKAANLPEARPYLARFAAFELAKCPGRERDAYEKLLALYQRGPTERSPSLITILKNLEEKLGIPANQRINEASSQ